MLTWFIIFTELKKPRKPDRHRLAELSSQCQLWIFSECQSLFRSGLISWVSKARPGPWEESRLSNLHFTFLRSERLFACLRVSAIKTLLINDRKKSSISLSFTHSWHYWNTRIVAIQSGLGLDYGLGLVNMTFLLFLSTLEYQGCENKSFSPIKGCQK